LGRDRGEAMPYWDRYDEGVFVGGRFGGSPMHVDQLIWSNVGKNFGGHKLLAIWPYGERGRDTFDEHVYSLFSPPLSEAERAALLGARSVALVCPGDVFVFSGGNAHMALSISKSLSLTSYESFLNFDTENLRAFLHSGTREHYRQCRTRQSTLDDMKAEVADSLRFLDDDLRSGAVTDPEVVAAAPAAFSELRRDDLIRRLSRAAGSEE